MKSNKKISLSMFAVLCCFSLFITLPCSLSLPIKAVNLGGWLVTEGWMTPQLFQGIPNGDMLDGTQVQFQCVSTGMYLCAGNGGNTIIVANRTSASGWETFKLWRVDQDHFQFKVFHNQFWGVYNNNKVIATSTNPGSSETFQVFRNPNNGDQVRIKAPNGNYLQAQNPNQVTADYLGDNNWGNNPSVFNMTAFGGIQGEYQVTNGWGSQAEQVMQNHWGTFVVESDFQFISQNGLNAVRIPVGWWIASDPNPPNPFVGGSLNALDNAFSWAGKYGVQVIIDLHAAPGSQNGQAHSATRDGSQNWGTSEANIQQTVGVIDFLTQRYANNSALLAVELINEPLAPGVTYNSLNEYYQDGYQTVRKYSSQAYVILSARIGPADPKEFYPTIMNNGWTKVVLDVHYYNLYSSNFQGMTVQQNIDYINNNRTGDLSYINVQNGPLTFVGEWVAEWVVQGANHQDYQRFAAAQIAVYGQATFGWSYWTLHCQYLHWDMQKMIQQGYISLD
ncbi:Glucan 1,3-beta-glucosidase A-like protein [Drosera capensis]